MMEMKLWGDTIPYYNEEAETPNLMTTYLIDTDKPLPCIVIYPGGGYGMRASDHEGHAIARFFNSEGMHAVIAEYRVSPNRHPAPLADAQRAIRLVRAHAEEWKVDPDRIVTLGFSAGGHLCATTVLFDDAYAGESCRDEIDETVSCAPNGAILCYPVISVNNDYGHIGSGKNLLGERYEDEKEAFSLAQYVNEKTPPVFLWHTSADAGVNVKNSLIFAERLRDAKIPFELHVFPKGPHGLGLAPDYPDVSKWAGLAADWVRREI